MVGRPELLEDPRFATNRERSQNADILAGVLLPWFQERIAEECFETAQLWRVPFSKVNSVADVLQMEQLRARGYFTSVSHPVAGEQLYPDAPFHLFATPWQAAGPAPLLGQHNEQVYGGRLGLRHDEMGRLRDQGVV